MTTAVFRTEGEHIVGFTVSGHTGYDRAGSDIVCAAVTSAVRLTECTLNTVMGLDIPFAVEEKSAAISCRLPADKALRDACQDTLAALMVYLTELREEYPDNIEVIEE